MPRACNCNEGRRPCACGGAEPPRLVAALLRLIDAAHRRRIQRRLRQPVQVLTLFPGDRK
jgi:hypothetical protein